MNARGKTWRTVSCRKPPGCVSGLGNGDGTNLPCENLPEAGATYSRIARWDRLCMIIRSSKQLFCPWSTVRRSLANSRLSDSTRRCDSIYTDARCCIAPHNRQVRYHTHAASGNRGFIPVITMLVLPIKALSSFSGRQPMAGKPGVLAAGASLILTRKMVSI